MKKSIDQLELAGKRVFIRCDFNVPLNGEGQITNDLRIVQALPTIKKALKDGAKVILASHFGRPKNGPEAKFSLAPVATRLTELLGQSVALLGDCVGAEVEAAVNALEGGQVVLLENVRFHKEETSKNLDEVKALAAQFAKFTDLFVMDAFGSAHRAHASVVGLAAHVEAACGYLVQKELEYFGKVMEAPEKPVVAIIGGAKVSDKIMLIENMLEKVDKVIIGGAMAYTFNVAQGRNVGDSLVELDKVDVAKNIMKMAEEKGVELILPLDTLCADAFSNDANTQVLTAKEDIPAGWEGLDVGPATNELFAAALADAKVIVWNGPVGVFEIDAFSVGTRSLAEVCAASSATTIIGGGDTATSVYKFGVEDKVSHISTGGGASLELLEGKTLPGVAALNEA